MRHLCWIPLALSALVSLGCGGSGPAIIPVSGTVNYDGKPLAYGYIEFIPKAGQHSGPAGEAEIVNGQFDTRKNGRGVVDGAHVVRVTGYAAKPAGGGDETQASTAAPPLFMGYSTLADSLKAPLTVAVPAGFTGESTEVVPADGNQP